MTNPSAAALIGSLDPADGPVETIETHISTLVFQNGWAYKVKRPVRYEFVDLSTMDKRDAICQREIEVNRRFAPDVYDALIPIRDAAGTTIDHAVRMRRLPPERRLSTLVVAEDSRVPSVLRAVARIVAIAHAGAPRGPHIDVVSTSDALEHLWARSIKDLRRFAGGPIDLGILETVATDATLYLKGRAALLRDRVTSGHIVDGHGDLLSSDIFCLDDGPRILDCLEFDDQLRYGDVLLDLAFLIMDLERLGRPDLGREFVRDYVEFSDEHHPVSLMHHYVAYRALVRSKVACLRGAEGDLAAAAEATTLLRLAESHLSSGRVRLTLVGGLPGSGKSTLADGVGDAVGALVLSSDVIRKELSGSGSAALPAQFQEGIYTTSITVRTYDVMFERAATALEFGQSVILDASFGDERWRRRGSDVAAATSSAFVAFCCGAPAEIREARLASRPYDPTRPSDATAEVARRMEAAADAWPDAVLIDTSAGIEVCRAAVLAALR